MPTCDILPHYLRQMMLQVCEYAVAYSNLHVLLIAFESIFLFLGTVIHIVPHDWLIGTCLTFFQLSIDR